MRTTGTTRHAARAAAIAMGLLLSGAAQATAQRDRPSTSCEPGRFKIALDVGHTVEAPGATSARGIKEFVFNLRLAKDTETALKDAGFAQTHLFTTQGTTRTQLFRRVERANALGVDVFVSIHHNDVQERYKSKWEYNGGTYAYSDRYSGHSLFISRENPRFDDSLAFGRLLGAQLKSRGLTYTRHHTEDIPGERRELVDPEVGVYRHDRLVVLMHTKVPAVLVEAGIIVNRDEELLLETPAHRAQIADATRAAITQFCSIQQSGPPKRPTTRKQP